MDTLWKPGLSLVIPEMMQCLDKHMSYNGLVEVHSKGLIGLQAIKRCFPFLSLSLKLLQQLLSFFSFMKRRHMHKPLLWTRELQYYSASFIRAHIFPCSGKELNALLILPPKSKLLYASSREDKSPVQNTQQICIQCVCNTCTGHTQLFFKHRLSDCHVNQCMYSWTKPTFIQILRLGSIWKVVVFCLFLPTFVK